MVRGLPDLVTSLVRVDAASTNAYGDYNSSDDIITFAASRDNIPEIVLGSPDNA